MMHVIVVGVESIKFKLSFVYRYADISRCARVFVAGIERLSQSALDTVKCHQEQNHRSCL